MSDTVWMSSVQSNAQIGMKQGLREKFYGHDWTPAEFEIPLLPDEVFNAMDLSSKGYSLRREQMPEAGAVWNEKAFSKVGNILAIGGFFAVRGKLAEVLSRFDLGDGELYPLHVYQADLTSPYPDEFFLLNFGARKDTVLPELCDDARKFVVRRATGKQVWKINQLQPDADVVLSKDALRGADLWIEDAVHNRIFMSDPLAQGIIEIGLKDVFRLQKCRLVGAGQ